MLVNLEYNYLRITLSFISCLFEYIYINELSIEVQRDEVR